MNEASKTQSFWTVLTMVNLLRLTYPDSGCKTGSEAW
jgi:hypothetical protein